MCRHNFLETDYASKVCVQCGLERRGPLRPRYHDVGDKAPLYISTYSRHKRFYNFLLCFYVLIINFINCITINIFY